MTSAACNSIRQHWMKPRQKWAVASSSGFESLRERNRGVAWRPPVVSHTAISISVTVPRAVSAIPAGEQRYIR